MDGVELVMAYEEAFALNIPDAAAEKMFHPRDVIDWLMAAQIRGEFFKEAHPKPVKWIHWVQPTPRYGTLEHRTYSRDEVAAEVRRITLESLGINAETYSEDAHFVEDFGIG